MTTDRTHHERLFSSNLRFESGATFLVTSDPQSEGSQVNGHGTFLVVCAPERSGKLAIWH
jgi:hypothetical protein